MNHPEDKSGDLSLGKSSSQEWHRMKEERGCGIRKLKMTEEFIVSKQSTMKNRLV